MSRRTKRICLGHVSGAHGIRGEVVITTFTAEPGAIGNYGPLESEDGARRFEVQSARATAKGVVARLSGIADRNAAEALRGTRLYVDRSQLPEPPAEEWYHEDLIGLAAVTPAGVALGEVVAVPNYGAGDLIEIRPSRGGDSLLVPFTAEVVPEVDVAAGRIVVSPPAEMADDGAEAEAPDPTGEVG